MRKGEGKSKVVAMGKKEKKIITEERKCQRIPVSRIDRGNEEQRPHNDKKMSNQKIYLQIIVIINMYHIGIT